MKAHVLKNGIVVNTIEVINLSHPVGPGETLIDGVVGGRGWHLVNGQLVEPAVVVPIPRAVSRRQGRLALLEAGKLDAVESEIAGIADPDLLRAAQIEYEAETWDRSSAFLLGMWAQIGGTEAELDDLFVLAATK